MDIHFTHLCIVAQTINTDEITTWKVNIYVWKSKKLSFYQQREHFALLSVFRDKNARDQFPSSLFL